MGARSNIVVTGFTEPENSYSNIAFAGDCVGANIIVTGFDDLHGQRIYLYGHWMGMKHVKILKDALKRGRGRWEDPSYLTRIIFSEMIKDDVMGERGFGISPDLIDNEYPLLTVNVALQTVTLEGYKILSFEDFIKNGFPEEYKEV